MENKKLSNEELECENKQLKERLEKATTEYKKLEQTVKDMCILTDNYRLNKRLAKLKK